LRSIGGGDLFYVFPQLQTAISSKIMLLTPKRAKFEITKWRKCILYIPTTLNGYISENNALIAIGAKFEITR